MYEVPCPRTWSKVANTPDPRNLYPHHCLGLDSCIWELEGFLNPEILRECLPPDPLIYKGDKALGSISVYCWAFRIKRDKARHTGETVVSCSHSDA